MIVNAFPAIFWSYLREKIIIEVHSCSIAGQKLVYITECYRQVSRERSSKRECKPDKILGMNNKEGVFLVFDSALTCVTVPRMYAEHVAHLRVTYVNRSRDYASPC